VSNVSKQCGAFVGLGLLLVLGLAGLPTSAGEPERTNGKPSTAAFVPADWPMYNHDLAGWRFNPAEQFKGVGTHKRASRPFLTLAESSCIVIQRMPNKAFNTDGEYAAG
jgi:hypothetical protein